MAEVDDTVEERERKEADELARFVHQRGVAEAYDELERRLDTWKTIQLNIGVIGATGVGKSTFINTMRRLKPSDLGAAPTGVEQTTMTPTSYEHPSNSSFKLWDIPGVGTSEFPRNCYLEQIQFPNYDFFVLVSSSRFTEDSLWLAQEIRKVDKRFYFVRSKVDIDVQNDRDDNPDTHSEDILLTMLKSECTSELSRAGFADPFVSLVCKNPLLYDFPALEEKLITDLPELKQEAALLTLRSTSTRIIKKKTAELRKRSHLVAIIAGFVGLVPVPGLSIVVDAAIILQELKLYKKVYGLDDEGLKQLCQLAHIPEGEAVDAIKENFWVNLTLSALLSEIEGYGVRIAAAETLKVIPVIGTAAGVASSVDVTNLLLRKALSSMELAILTVIDIALSKNPSSR